MGKIVFIGHSLIKGIDYGGVTRVDTFAYKIGVAAGYSPADICIKGVSGDTAAGLLARLQPDVIGLVPDVCVVMIGANDWSSGVTIAAFTRHLRAIAQAIVDAGVKLVLFTDNMNRGSVAEFVSLGFFQDVIRKIAVEFDAPVVDVFSRMCFKALCNDHVQYYSSATEKIHLSVAGNNWVAQIAAETSPKDMFVKSPVTAPPIEDSPEGDVRALSLALADYLLGGQTEEDLNLIEDIRVTFGSVPNVE